VLLILQSLLEISHIRIFDSTSTLVFQIFLAGMGILYVYLGPSRCPYTRIHEKLRIAKLAGLCADILTTKKHKYSHSRSIDQVLLPCRRENNCARGVDNGMHSDLYRVSHWWFKIFLMSSTVQHDETVKGRQTDHNIK
jgi:hypothetical protein